MRRYIGAHHLLVTSLIADKL